jgi:small subunit ribosomal protein S8
MVGDKVSNLIISLKNASQVGKETVALPFTKHTQAILETLKREGYIADIATVDDGIKKTLKVTIKYGEDKKPVINDVQRVSKQSRRVYKQSKELFPIKNGYGLTVLSTPAGIMSGKAARKKNLGGEVLFHMW